MFNFFWQVKIKETSDIPFSIGLVENFLDYIIEFTSLPSNEHALSMMASPKADNIVTLLDGTLQLVLECDLAYGVGATSMIC